MIKVCAQKPVLFSNPLMLLKPSFMPTTKVFIFDIDSRFFKIFFVKTNKIKRIATALNPIPINEPNSSVCPSKIIARNSRKSSNFKIRTKRTRLNKMIKSIALSKMMVPKSLSTGTSSV